MTRALVLLALSVLFSGAAIADVRDDFRACEQTLLRRLPRGAAPSASSPAEQYCLGLGFWFSSPANPLPHDPARSAEWLQRAAAAGVAGAQTALGYLYEKGYGVPQDVGAAVQWYRKAAAQGDASATFNLGRLASIGRGVPKDEVEASRLFKEAESRGSADARVDARDSRQYEELERPERASFEAGFKAYQAKDYPRAAQLYQRAAAAGNASAQVALGQLYRQGLGVPRDPTRAVALYRTAAERGHAGAQAQLGLCYELGEGVKESWSTAIQWYKKSAEQLHPLGLLCMGRMYQFGMAVPQDRQKAVRWFELAENQGEQQAAFFARWLKVKTNCLGYRDDAEREKFLGICSDPRGKTFANSTERTAWLAETMSHVDVRMFGDGGYTAGACGANGGSFSSGNCYGSGGVIIDPYGSQDRYGNNLW